MEDGEGRDVVSRRQPSHGGVDPTDRDAAEKVLFRPGEQSTPSTVRSGRSSITPTALGLPAAGARRR